MRVLHAAGLMLAIAIVPTRHANAEEKSTLTLEGALALARERAPAVLAARARIDEARGRLIGASVRMRGNPSLEGAFGRRTADGEDFNELELEFAQGLGVAGRRRARIAGAEAGVSSEMAGSQDVERRASLEVAEAFFRVLRAREQIRLWRTSHEIASEICLVAERRFQAGDVAVLDVQVARVAQARARSEILTGEAELWRAAGDLGILLDLESLDPETISDDLEGDSEYELPQLVEKAILRPDIAALAAQIDQAEAETRLGMTSRRLEFDVGLRYKEEENAQAMLGVLAVTLPVFDHGRGIVSEASSRAARLRMEHEALRRTVAREVQTAFDIHQRRLEAAAAVGLVLPGLTETDELATKSYEAGQISLVDLLLLRRGLLETRILHVDRLFEAAVSRVQLEASAGVLR